MILNTVEKIKINLNNKKKNGLKIIQKRLNYFGNIIKYRKKNLIKIML